jgi:hypothetical protein
MNAFPPEVIEKLGYYVYRLIDPRSGETFYVGKGRASRVFQHARGELVSSDDALTEKLSRIREIRLVGLEVQHVIHRHGLDETTAYEVESALLDAFPGLTNVQGGHRADEFGIMHAQEIVNRYQARETEIRHSLLIITINRTAEERSVYDAVRFAWKIDPGKARNADYVLASVQGVVRGVFVASRWLPATQANFPEFGLDRPGRWGFEGYEALPEVRDTYLNTRVPDRFRKPGTANPVRYVLPNGMR